MLTHSQQITISEQVQVHFPEVAAVTPTIRELPNGNWQLTYQTNASLPTGFTLRRVVRVTVNDEGTILRLSTSR